MLEVPSYINRPKTVSNKRVAMIACEAKVLVWTPLDQIQCFLTFLSPNDLHFSIKKLGSTIDRLVEFVTNSQITYLGVKKETRF